MERHQVNGDEMRDGKKVLGVVTTYHSVIVMVMVDGTLVFLQILEIGLVDVLEMRDEILVDLHAAILRPLQTIHKHVHCLLSEGLDHAVDSLVRAGTHLVCLLRSNLNEIASLLVLQREPSIKLADETRESSSGGITCNPS